MMTLRISVFLAVFASAMSAQVTDQFPDRVVSEIERENRQPATRPTDSSHRDSMVAPVPPENHQFTRDRGGFLVVERVGPTDIKIGVWPAVQSFVAHSPAVQATRVSFAVAKVDW